MKKTIIFLVLATLIFTKCYKEEIVHFDQEPEPALLFIDSIWANPNGIDFQKVKIEDKMSLLRGEKTIIFSQTLTLNIYTALDFYIPKSKLEADMRYTAVMTPIQGNPNLNLCSHLPNRKPPYRMIDDDFKEGVEKLSCTKDVLLEEEVELNFLVKGQIGDVFHWEIYKEPVPPVDTNIVYPECTCGEPESEILICENFDQYESNNPANISPYFLEHEGENGRIYFDVDGGEEPNGLLYMNDSESLDVYSLLDLGIPTRADYKLTWTFNLEDLGIAQIKIPFASAIFRFNENAERGNIRLFNYYSVSFNIPDTDWIEFELMFDMARNLYRFEMGNIYYFWQSTSVNLDNPMLIEFATVRNGYKVDNICFEKLPE